MKRAISSGLCAAFIITALMAFQSFLKTGEPAQKISLPNRKPTVGETIRRDRSPSQTKTKRISSSDFDAPEVTTKAPREETWGDDDFADILAELEPETSELQPMLRYEEPEISYFIDYLTAVAMDDGMEPLSQSQDDVIDLEEPSRSNLNSLAQEILDGESDAELDWLFSQ